MRRNTFEKLPLGDLNVIVIEDVGNLLYPVEGEDMKVVVLSTAEGNDKPFKYPAMFRKSSAVIANKITCCPTPILR